MTTGNAASSDANANGGAGRTTQAGSGSTSAATPAQATEPGAPSAPVTEQAAADSGGKPA